jgi:hypothetical protein
VAGVKPLCGLARVMSENSLRATKGPLRWTGGASAVGDIAHREVVIYVYTAMVRSRLVWDVSTNAITARVQGITYLQNHRSERPISCIDVSHLQRPSARAHAQLNYSFLNSRHAYISPSCPRPSCPGRARAPRA